ncbi:MptD family putative ECF transporter S component [Arcanobacterium buesumense]|uniref:MptD family putative ECF transporter S component n=1 Tax=Arcanobacterium buesumense TaxID=2722751 RepID=A0A6H2EM30_9ACTO|nr:MptD family putative ECF transporter S component [Arcanobacterium buesumense]QJC22135.1 MptD family putative ECF transporter S component [Arcanobacterium buesumense]
MSDDQMMPALTTRSASGTNAQKIVYIGVFTAIYFVVFFTIGMLGFFGPYFMFISIPLSLLIEGTVIVLMLNKIRAFGALSILGIIVGLLMMLTGHAWTTLVFTTLTSFIADLVAKSGNYVNGPKNIFAYAILQVWYFGAWLPIFYGADAYFADVAVQMGQQYADQMQALFTPIIIVIFTIANFFVSLIGGWIGTIILRKNFAKAGIA